MHRQRVHCRLFRGDSVPQSKLHQLKFGQANGDLVRGPARDRSPRRWEVMGAAQLQTRPWLQIDFLVGCNSAKGSWWCLLSWTAALFDGLLREPNAADVIHIQRPPNRWIYIFIVLPCQQLWKSDKLHFYIDSCVTPRCLLRDEHLPSTNQAFQVSHLR